MQVCNTYWSIIEDLAASSSISHSFPPQIEAQVYFAAAGVETFDTPTEEIQPYLLAWPLDHRSPEIAECPVLALLRRPGGILLALPTGFCLHIF